MKKFDASIEVFFIATQVSLFVLISVIVIASIVINCIMKKIKKRGNKIT